MPKTIIKEIIITLLLLVAIILALGLLFYDYVPVSKIVPEVQSYKMPNTVSETLANDLLTNSTEVIITREIESDDLSVYEKSKDYKKGKANPFEPYEAEETKQNNVNGTINSSAKNSNNESNNSQTTNINKSENNSNNIDSTRR